MTDHIATLRSMLPRDSGGGMMRTVRDALKAAIAALEREQQAGVPEGWHLAYKLAGRMADDRMLYVIGPDGRSYAGVDTDLCPVAAAPPPPAEARPGKVAKRQYFYKVLGCPADGARDDACICWHDEGTGPLADGEGVRHWRDKPAAEARPVVDDVLAKYVAARDAYEAATRPPNSHARAPVLKHGDPVMVRYREARAALDAAIAGQQGGRNDG